MVGNTILTFMKYLYKATGVGCTSKTVICEKLGYGKVHVPWMVYQRGYINFCPLDQASDLFSTSSHRHFEVDILLIIDCVVNRFSLTSIFL